MRKIEKAAAVTATIITGLIFWVNVYPATIKKQTVLIPGLTEATPFVLNGKLDYLVTEKTTPTRLSIYDFKDNKKITTFGEGLDFASATTYDNTLYVFGTKDPAGVNKSELYVTTTSDLVHFSDPVFLYKASPIQGFFNTSVTYNPDKKKFIMALEVYEEGLVTFTFRFLESPDAIHWTQTPYIFGNKYYVAAPALKYLNGYYYLWYLKEEYTDESKKLGRTYQTHLARSKDLSSWEISPKTFMAPEGDEGTNTSDIDLVDYKGKTYIIYGIGDQATWAKLKYATFNGSMTKLVNQYF